MEIKAFTLCAFAEDSNGLLVVRKPLARIGVPSVPTKLNKCYLATRIQFDNTDAKALELTYQFILPGKGHAITPRPEFVDVRSLLRARKNATNIVFALTGIPLPEIGEYSIHLSTKGKILRALSLHVFLEDALGNSATY
jgi:hypothetical protein